ncbi:MAG: porin family protein [Rickettsiales bacterium]|nr:porin family protein [Rickettsiales bacterium]
MRSSLESKTSKESSVGNTDTYFNDNKKDTSYGFGIEYNYAFNFNNFFIAPGVFYELTNVETNRADGANYYNQDLDINSRYGVKANFGYDVSDQFSAYIPVGYAVNNYELKTKDYFGSSHVSLKQTGSESAFLYGIGFSYSPVDSISVNLEYNRSSFDIKTKTDIALVGDVKLKTENDLNVIKLGVSYKF